MASASEEFQEKYATHRSGKVKVTILASEWGSSKGGLSTINRTLSIQLAKSSDVEISFFVPQCSEKDKKEALRHNIRIVEATQLVAFEELDLLSFPPDGLEIEVVIGHGVKLGRQAQVIKRSHRCKWVQVVHTDPEEIGMFKCYSDPISRGEEKHNDEVKLCEKADFVVGIGPKLAEAFRSYLRFCRSDRTILDFTPGIFEEFRSVEQVHEERNHRSVLVFGRGDVKDFKLKGFDIAGKAIASLIDTRLVFVGAPNGKHDEVKESFMQCGLSANHLRVRGYDNSRESLRQLFCEVDLVIMPSRTDGFGLTGLEALSAGLPVLVSKNSGFGEALCKVPLCSPFVIDSDNPDVWAAAIKNIIWDKDRHCRLDEANRMRILYDEKYSWPRQSDALRSKIIKLADACLLQLQIDAVAITAASAQKGKRTEVPSWKPQEVIQEVGEPNPTKKQQTLINTGLATENCGNGSIQSTQAVFNKIVETCFQHVDPSNPEQLNGFICNLERVHKVLFHHVETGSLIITVEVGSEEILEKLWQDYRKGHLNEMAQEFLVTEELLKEFGLIEFKLTTFISEEEYKACQRFFSGYHIHERRIGESARRADFEGLPMRSLQLQVIHGETFFKDVDFSNSSAVNKFITNDLQLDEASRNAISQVVDLLYNHLQHNLPQFSINKLVKGGSVGKGTAVKDKADIDCVVFLNNVKTMGEHKLNLQNTKNRLELCLKQSPYKDRITFGKQTPFAVKFHFRLDLSREFDIDLLPTFTTDQSLEKLYDEMIGCKTEEWGYYSAHFVSLQKEFVKGQPPIVKDLIRLVKYWRKTCIEDKSGGRLPSSYPLELITIHCWEKAGKPKSFDIGVGFKAALQQLVDNRHINVRWCKYYSEALANRGMERITMSDKSPPFVLDPANPTNNVCSVSNAEGWKTVADVAKMTLERQPLKDVSVKRNWQI